MLLSAHGAVNGATEEAERVKTFGKGYPIVRNLRKRLTTPRYCDYGVDRAYPSHSEWVYLLLVESRLDRVAHDVEDKPPYPSFFAAEPRIIYEACERLRWPITDPTKLLQQMNGLIQDCQQRTSFRCCSAGWDSVTLCINSTSW